MRTLTSEHAGYYTFVEPAVKVSTWERVKARLHWVDLVLIAPMVIAIILSA